MLSRLPEFPPSTGTTWGQWSQLSCCKRCWMEKGGTPTEIRHFCCSVSSLGHVGDYLSRWTSPCSVIIVWNGILPDVSNHLHEGLLPRVHFQHLECFNLLQLVNWFPTLIPLRISFTRFTLVSFCSICLVWYLSIMYHTLAESSLDQVSFSLIIKVRFDKSYQNTRAFSGRQTTRTASPLDKWEYCWWIDCWWMQTGT